MKKDKRGLALITAIAVLALMLILFGGLATVYSAQVNRGKAELEQSQAMLIAQSYAEMLDQVLSSSNGEVDDFKEALGSIRTGREVEIESSLIQPVNVIDAQVKITATADKESVNGNTTTRKIKIKVSATVDEETRSIDLDYTYMYSRNALNLQKYSVYGNQINVYSSYGDLESDHGERINFEEVWYDDDDNEVDLETYDDDDLYRVGYLRDQPVFTIEKDEDVLPDDYTEENKNELLNDFALAKNGDAEPTVLQPWKNLDQPSENIPNCSELNDNRSNKIETSCIWDLENKNNGTVQVVATSEDIIIYMPINGNLKLDDFKINFNGGNRNNLFIYAYGNGELIIDSSAKISTENDDDVTDIYFISNDVIDINIDGNGNGNAKDLEAYFYFPKGTVILDGTSDRIKGALIADRIALLRLDRDPFEMEYVKPKKEVLENAGIGDSESGSAIISFTLNGYNEGGKS